MTTFNLTSPLCGGLWVFNLDELPLYEVTASKYIKYDIFHDYIVINVMPTKKKELQEHNLVLTKDGNSITYKISQGVDVEEELNIALFLTYPTGTTLYYNGLDLQLLTSGATTNDGYVKYSLDKINWTTDYTTLKGKNIGTYTVYYLIIGNPEHQNSEIKKLDVFIKEKSETTPTITTIYKVYAGCKHGYTSSVKALSVDELKAISTEYEISSFPYSNSFNCTDQNFFILFKPSEVELQSCTYSNELGTFNLLDEYGLINKLYEEEGYQLYGMRNSEMAQDNPQLFKFTFTKK